jgi:class 3 adenylate cyclase
MIGEFGGRIIDTAGDGILAEFSSVVNASNGPRRIFQGFIGYG